MAESLNSLVEGSERHVTLKNELVLIKKNSEKELFGSENNSITEKDKKIQKFKKKIN